MKESILARKLAEYSYRDLAKEQLINLSPSEVFQTSYIRIPSKMNKYSDISEYTERCFLQKDIAIIFNVSTQTLRNWKKRGLI
jgi:DNA-binding transcriptional regulator YiaG